MDVGRFRSLLESVDLAALAKAHPDKNEHPFTYCKEVVIPAIEAKGESVDDPDTFCGWWKAERAAEMVPEGKVAREINVLGGVGQLRSGKYQNKDHIVVPVVALMEGVIHAINAETPELVTLSCLASAPQGWNGRPIVLGHPVRDGRQISANSPEVLEQQMFGRVFNARIDGTRLCMDAWIDPVAAEAVGAGRMLERIKKEEMIEVSIGAFVVAESSTGAHNGKQYKAVWKDLVPDHLAFLPKGVGACSIAMGCGSPRMAMMVTAEGMEAISEEKAAELIAAGHRSASSKKMRRTVSRSDNYTDAERAEFQALAAQVDLKALKDEPTADKEEHPFTYCMEVVVPAMEKDGKGPSDPERFCGWWKGEHKAAQAAERKKGRSAGSIYDTPGEAASEEAAELIMYQTMRQLCDQLGETYDSLSGTIDELIDAEEENPTRTPEEEKAEEEIEAARLESIRTFSMAMYSSVNALMDIANKKLYPPPLPMNGVDVVRPSCCSESRAAAGARHSAEDRDIIQKVHDNAVSLGAKCDSRNSAQKALDESMKAAEGKEMTKVEKAAAKLSADYTVEDAIKEFELSTEEAAELRKTAKTERSAAAKGDAMGLTAEKRTEMIRALVANKHSGFVSGDEKILEGASDERLESFRVAAAAREVEVNKKTENPAESRTLAAGKQLTEDEFMALAPDSIRSLISRQKEADTTQKTALVAALKTAQSEYSESELAAMSNDNLQRFARAIGVDAPAPVDFTGRGLPRVLTEHTKESDVYANPPDPYAEGIKALRAAQGLQ